MRQQHEHRRAESTLHWAVHVFVAAGVAAPSGGGGGGSSTIEDNNAAPTTEKGIDTNSGDLGGARTARNSDAPPAATVVQMAVDTQGIEIIEEPSQTVDIEGLDRTDSLTGDTEDSGGIPPLLTSAGVNLRESMRNFLELDETEVLDDEEASDLIARLTTSWLALALLAIGVWYTMALGFSVTKADNESEHQTYPWPYGATDSQRCIARKFSDTTDETQATIELVIATAPIWLRNALLTAVITKILAKVTGADPQIRGD